MAIYELVVIFVDGFAHPVSNPCDLTKPMLTQKNWTRKVRTKTAEIVTVYTVQARVLRASAGSGVPCLDRGSQFERAFAS